MRKIDQAIAITTEIDNCARLTGRLAEHRPCRCDQDSE
jgi:hypothetical protein